MKMNSDHYIIDPEGDLMFIWEESPSGIVTDLVKIESEETMSFSPTTTSTDLAEDMAPTVISDSTSETLVQESADSARETQKTTTSVADDIVEKIKIRVSSKHLALASPFFQSILNQGDEIPKVASDSILVPVSVQNIDALLITLNIMHCRAGKVPHFIDLNMLCTVAVLVDYYSCLEAAGAFTAIWIGNLKRDFPKKSTTQLTTWIWITWVFRNDYLFNKATLIAVRESTGPIVCPSLPIPKDALDRIEDLRQYYVCKVVESVYVRFECLIENWFGCADCNALALGSLIQQLNARQLYPPPKPPFAGLSLEIISKRLRTISDPACRKLHHATKSCSGYPYVLIPETKDSLDNLEKEVIGLDVRRY